VRSKIFPSPEEAVALGQKPPMFVKEHVEPVKDKEGNRYEVCVSKIGHMPIVESGQTGRHWSLHIFDVIDLARRAGIDDPNYDFETCLR